MTNTLLRYFFNRVELEHAVNARKSELEQIARVAATRFGWTLERARFAVEQEARQYLVQTGVR